MKLAITKISMACLACTILASCGSGDDPAPSGDGAGEQAKPTPAKDPASGGATAAVTHPIPGDPEAGKVVYMRICVACHQPDGSGLNGMLAADFVKDKTRLAKSNEELTTSIREGITRDGKVMPPQKDVLSETEIKDAISYIRVTFGGNS